MDEIPDRAKSLALIYQAIDDAEKEMHEFKADHKARVETLLKQAYYLRRDILSGQMSLVPEGPPPSKEDVV